MDKKTDKELLELAAKNSDVELLEWEALAISGRNWNPFADEGQRYQLIRKLGMSIDFTECTVTKRLPNHTLLQEWWGGDCGDEAHAILRVAAAIGGAK